MNALLIPELTIDGNDFMLIISCDGISEGMKYVNLLYSSAPNINGWNFVKYRQPKKKTNLNFNGLELRYEDIKIARVFDFERNKVDVALLMKNYSENDKRFQSLGFLYLDHHIGEFNTITRVGAVEFANPDSNNAWNDVETIDLIQLKNEIAGKLY